MAAEAVRLGECKGNGKDKAGMSHIGEEHFAPLASWPPLYLTEWYFPPNSHRRAQETISAKRPMSLCWIKVGKLISYLRGPDFSLLIIIEMNNTLCRVFHLPMFSARWSHAILISTNDPLPQYGNNYLEYNPIANALKTQSASSARHNHRAVNITLRH